MAATAEIAAILSAVMFPLGLILLKKGYGHSAPMVGTIVVTLINAMLFWVLAAFLSPVHLISWNTAIFFVLGGVIGHGIGRYLQFTGVHYIGPARNTTAIATSAFFSSVIAIIFLGEKPGLATLAGTTAIILGVMILVYEKSKAKWNKLYLAFPLFGAVLYGVMNTLYKFGLQSLPDAFISAAVGLTGATLTLLLMSLIPGLRDHGKAQLPNIRKALHFFAAAGIVNTIGLVLNFQALNLGQVTVVYPLIASQPLFAVLFGHIFLKETEKISLHVVLGAVAVVAGIVTITLL
jgi:drug/metabolite transporter, DME family